MRRPLHRLVRWLIVTRRLRDPLALACFAVGVAIGVD
jgi:hypothetical protein